MENEVLEAAVDDEAGRAALAQRIAAEEHGDVWDPRRNRGAEELECDPSAYSMLHSLQVEWPWLSFDVVADDLGGGRTVFPHSLVAVCGSQASTPAGNKLTLLRLDGLAKTDGDDDSEDDSDDDSDAARRQPVATACEVAHPGAVRRVACATGEARGVVASWSDDDARVRVWDLRRETAAYCAPTTPTAVAAPTKKTPLASTAGDAPGYALAWKSSLLAFGDDAGTVRACSLRPSGSLDVVASWKNSQSCEDVAWSPTEATVVMAVGADRAVSVFDTRHSRAAMLRRTEAHASDVNCLSWNASVSYLVATGGDDGCLRVWDLRAFGPAAKPVGSFDYHASEPIVSVQWDPTDESAVAVASADHSVTLWDLSVEDTHDDAPPPLAPESSLPPQLLFVHQGIHDPKEVKHHPQIPGLVLTTAANGLSLFIPALHADSS